MRVEPGTSEAPWKVGDEIDLGALRRLIVQRRRWILLPTLAAFVVSAIAVNVIKPRYTAEARIVLENQQNYLPGPDKSETGVTQQLDAEAVGSQVQILTSRDLARKVIRTVGLQGNPEFDPLADGMGAVERLLVLCGLKRDPTRLSPEDRILESYFERLTVLSPTKTRVLTIEFGSRDPDLSARIANAIADLYLEFQSDAKRDHAKAAAASLGTLVADLKTRVAAADARAEAFRSQAGLLVGSNNTSVNAQQLTDVNTELAKARTAQADTQAKANLLREMIRQGRISDLADVSNNELVRRITEQRVTAKAQLALEGRTLLPGHPRIKELTAQVADLEGEIRATGEKTARSLESEAKIASARVANLAKALDVQKQLIGASGSDEVQMRELDRAARSLKDELEATTTRYQEALAREGSKAASSDARIFSRALAPQVASFPKKLPIIAISTLAALVLAVGLVAAREFLLVPPALPTARRRPAAAPTDRGETLSLVSGAPAHAAAARSDRASTLNTAAVSNAVATPKSPALPTAATFKGAAAPRPTQPENPAGPGLDEVIADMETLGLPTGGLVLAVSPEGADDSGLGLALARRLVGRGRVVLVAGDAHTLTPEPDCPGLAELLAGTAAFSDAIHRDRNSRLHVIPAGRADQAARTDLGAVLDALRGTYDVVVFGAPHVMRVDEARAVMSRTALAVVGLARDTQAAEMMDVMRDAGVPHILRVVRQTNAAVQAA